MKAVKSITGPTIIDNLAPVTSQAISSEEITSLEIDIPRFDDTDGPIRYNTVNVLCYYFDCLLLQSLLHCDYQCYSA